MVGIINSDVYTKGSSATLGVWKGGHGHPRILLGVIKKNNKNRPKNQKNPCFQKLITLNGMVYRSPILHIPLGPYQDEKIREYLEGGRPFS